MNLGFIGNDLELQVIRKQLDLDPRHNLVAFVQDSASPTSANTLFFTTQADRPIPKRCTELDELLFYDSLDALILGGPIELRPDRLRRVIQLGRHCLCLVPADLSALVYHELAMSAADTKAVLMPWLPARLHAAWQELFRICRSGLIGLPRQIIIDRSGPMPSGRLLMSQIYAEVNDLLSDVAGEITELTATGDLDAGRLIVQHRTSTGVLGEIRLTTSAGEDRCRVSIEAASGHAEMLWASGLSGPAVLHWTGLDGNHEFAQSNLEPTRSLFSELSRARDGLSHTPNWNDAIRAAELADCAWQSLERRRAVDVYREKRTELASFKGRMTSIGCGLIWFTLLILIVIAAGKGLQLPGMDYMAAALALVWVTFLGVQTLRWIFPRDLGQTGVEKSEREKFGNDV